MKLKRGDVVFLTRERNDTLRLIPSALAEKEAVPRVYVIKADQCSKSGLLERVVVGNYVLGRDTVCVESKKRMKSSQVDEIRGIVPKLMGLGIIEETSNRIVLQCSIDPSKFPIHTLIRRLYIITS
ncbi:MAG: hypothetical protein KAW09_02180, partial [Thermoplasmata archaeon]|nr:hypothetical protein [Thermoplasmata archaeon]